MPEFNELDSLSFVTLVDRTGGPSEFVFDGKRFTFDAKKAIRTVPSYIAEWLFRQDKARVHTLGHGFTHRYGVQDGPEELLASLGEECLDCSPISIDLDRIEGWDAEAVDPNRASATTIQLRRRPEEFAHQGGATAPTFSGKER